MPGIEDLMNLRTQGGTANVPPMPPQGMGGPPPGMAGGPPPGMGGEMAGGPPPGMGGGMGETPVGMGGGMGGPPVEEAVNVEQDSAMLAEAVVDRTQGDIGAAIAVLDNAKAMLMSSVEGSQDPMMANMGRPLMRRDGGPMYANMGRPLYREDGGTMADDDVLRQMIMDNLQKPEIQEQAMANVMGQSGGRMSDRDRAIADLMRFNQS
tara:strand:- start:261 stop:884 length:624 start_codon:yes stop_codon:yes gene_type:complete